MRRRRTALCLNDMEGTYLTQQGPANQALCINTVVNLVTIRRAIIAALLTRDVRRLTREHNHGYDGSRKL